MFVVNVLCWSTQVWAQSCSRPSLNVPGTMAHTFVKPIEAAPRPVFPCPGQPVFAENATPDAAA
jgi:hypothetical protein